MIAHRMSAGKKTLVHRFFRLRRRIDDVIVYASNQRRFVVETLGHRADRVHLSPFMVDTGFWSATRVEATPRGRPMICSAGQELRDYPTLVEAVRGLDVDVVLAAASPWSRRADTTSGVDLPDNVSVARLDLHALRQLYADAAFVVVPLVENDFQAGITTILEAMAIGRAVICTRTEGQTDTVTEGVTGLYVPVGDVAALRRAIERLLAEPHEANRLSAAARHWAVDHADIEVYAKGLSGLTRL